MTTELYKEVRQFKGLKNDEDPKQISHEYFSSVKNFNYPDTGVLGINKILSPEVVKIYLSPDLTTSVTDTILITGDTIATSLKSTAYLWNDSASKWNLMIWG